VGIDRGGGASPEEMRTDRDAENHAGQQAGVPAARSRGPSSSDPRP
jgi:hypothetical protein